MAIQPLQQPPAIQPAGNDEIRGRALVAHVEAQLARAEAANPQGKPASGPS